MRIREVVFLSLFLSTPLFCQDLWPKKDLVFAQVAAGGGYESLITVTNRGTDTYNGVLLFYRLQAQRWNPLVNGLQTINGGWSISIPPAATRTFQVTSGQTVESGFAAFVANDLSQTSFLEGNLTYFVKGGSTILDSVGVSPSTEFTVGGVAFEDLDTIALAIGNLRSTKANATLKIILNDGKFTLTGTTILESLSHDAFFLSDRFLVKILFPGLKLGRGRLEIQSDVPIFGTALTLIGGEFSSLPLLPMPTSYTLVAQASGGPVVKGTLSLWAEDIFVKGYLQVTQVNGAPITPENYVIHGQLRDGVLTVCTSGNGAAFLSQATNLFAQFNTFSFTSDSVSGTYVGTLVDPGLSANSTYQGTFSMTRIK
ncbi:MAG: hypothetical protein LAO31_04600 [Acidobacteriia bacterium]|nr:hypothetical protein [Terriglobia bacterium]